MSNRAANQPSNRARLDCNPKASCWSAIVVTWMPSSPMTVLDARWLRDVIPKFLYSARCVIGSIGAAKSSSPELSRICGQAPP